MRKCGSRSKTTFRDSGTSSLVDPPASRLVYNRTMRRLRSLAGLLMVAAFGCEGTTGEPTPAEASTMDSSSVGDAGDSAIADSMVADTAVTDATPDGDVTVPPNAMPVWVGVGAWGFRSSTRDGMTWNTTLNPEQGNDHTPDLLRDVGYGNGVFIAVGGDRNAMVMRSTDGVAWTEDHHPGEGQWKGGVAYGGGRWVAVGGVGTNMYSDDDGETWTDNSERLPAAGRDIHWGNGRFVAVGDGGMIASSTDGLTWSDHTQVGAVGLGSVTYGHGVWAVTGSRWNGSGFDTSCFLSSDEAQSWTACSFTSTRLDGVVFTNNRLIVPHAEGYEESTDGAGWHRVDQRIPGRVFEAEGLWVGVGNDRRYSGASLDSLTESTAERGFRSFTMGWVTE